MNTDPKNFNKKIYCRPELITYGDIHKITQAVGKTGTADGSMDKGPAANNKTST